MAVDQMQVSPLDTELTSNLVSIHESFADGAVYNGEDGLLKRLK